MVMEVLLNAVYDPAAFPAVPTVIEDVAPATVAMVAVIAAPPSPVMLNEDPSVPSASR
jgi:hypothetical protein